MDVELIQLNMYYMYAFVPSSSTARLLGYKAFHGRTDGKHDGPKEYQPIIRIFPSEKDGEAYPLKGADPSDVLWTEPQGTDSKFTLADLLNYSNISLDKQGAKMPAQPEAQYHATRRATAA